MQVVDSGSDCWKGGEVNPEGRKTKKRDINEKVTTGATVEYLELSH